MAYLPTFVFLSTLLVISDSVSGGIRRDADAPGRLRNGPSRARVMVPRRASGTPSISAVMTPLAGKTQKLRSQQYAKRQSPRQSFYDIFVPNQQPPVQRQMTLDDAFKMGYQAGKAVAYGDGVGIRYPPQVYQVYPGGQQTYPVGQQAYPVGQGLQGSYFGPFYTFVIPEGQGNGQNLPPPPPPFDYYPPTDLPIDTFGLGVDDYVIPPDFTLGTTFPSYVDIIEQSPGEVFVSLYDDGLGPSSVTTFGPDSPGIQLFDTPPGTLVPIDTAEGVILIDPSQEVTIIPGRK